MPVLLFARTKKEVVGRNKNGKQSNEQIITNGSSYCACVRALDYTSAQALENVNALKALDCEYADQTIRTEAISLQLSIHIRNGEIKMSSCVMLIAKTKGRECKRKRVREDIEGVAGRRRAKGWENICVWVIRIIS